MPFTTPEVETVPKAVLLLLHVPPLVASANARNEPTQVFGVPVIAAGVGLTVKGSVAMQPVGNVNVIVIDPAAIPETTPVPEPIVATAVLLLLHVELPEPSVNVVGNPPAQTLVAPEIAAGKGLTVAVTVVKQPVGKI